MSLTKIDRLVLARLIKKSMQWINDEKQNVIYAYPSALFWGCWKYIKFNKDEFFLSAVETNDGWRVVDSRGHQNIKCLKSVGKSKKEYVYVAFSKKMDACKIGVTVDIERRLKELKTGVPDIESIAIFHTGEVSARHIERELHSYFCNESIGGEWFKLGGSKVEINNNVFDAIKSKWFSFIL